MLRLLLPEEETPGRAEEKALINENSINEQGRKQNEGEKKVNEEKINVRVEAGEFAVPAAAEDMFSSGICSGFNKLYTYTKIKERRKEETLPTSRVSYFAIRIPQKFR